MKAGEKHGTGAMFEYSGGGGGMRCPVAVNRQGRA